MSDKFFKKFDESSKIYESVNDKIGGDFPSFEEFSKVYEQTFMDDIRDQQAQAARDRAKRAEDRRYATQDAIEKQKDSQSFMKRYNTMLQKARYHGTNVFKLVFETTPLDIKIDPIRAEFYDNMVTLDKGMKPENKEAILQEIAKVAEKLKGVTNYDPKSTVITITGTANNKAATMDAGGPEENLDHRGKAYGGEDPNNEYLARQRAISVKKAIEDQFDEGVEFRIESKVVPTEREQDKYIYVTASSKGDIKSKILTGQLELGITSNLQVKTGAELAQSEGMPTPQGPIANEKFYYGRRTITIVPANGVAKSYTLSWDGQGPIFDTGDATTPKKRVGGWKSGGADNKNRMGAEGTTVGDPLPNTGNAREAIEEALKTSGAFTPQEAQQILGKFTDGDDQFFNNPDNMRIETSTEGWKKFVTTIGIGTSNPKPSLTVAENSGAMIIDKTVDPPKIINPVT